MTSLGQIGKPTRIIFADGGQERYSVGGHSARNVALLLARNPFFVETRTGRVVVDPLTAVVFKSCETVALHPLLLSDHPRYLYLEIEDAVRHEIGDAVADGDPRLLRFRRLDNRRERGDLLASMLRASARLIRSLKTSSPACEDHALALVDMLPAGDRAERAGDLDGALSQRCMEIALGQGILSFREIADQLEVPAFSLYRRFQQEIGNSIHKHLNTVRLASAWTWLDDSDCSITEVALALGFSSHSHFTSVFRHRFGFPPSRRHACAWMSHDTNYRGVAGSP